MGLVIASARGLAPERLGAVVQTLRFLANNANALEGSSLAPWSLREVRPPPRMLPVQRGVRSHDVGTNRRTDRRTDCNTDCRTDCRADRHADCRADRRAD